MLENGKKNDYTHEEGISPEVIAAITAAFIKEYGNAFKIKRVRFLNCEQHPTWQFAGRLNIMSSHQIHIKR